VSLPAELLPSASLPVLDVDTVLARLPAGSRAQLAWAKKPIADSLDRLCTERLDGALFDATADSVWLPLWRISREFFKAMTERRDELAAVVMKDLGVVESRLREHLGDEDAADTLVWILGFLRAYADASLNVLPHVWPLMTEIPAEDVAGQREMRFLMRGYVALMGASELSRRALDPARAGELVDIAFLELTRFKQELERVGVRVAPFPFQTVEERRERQALYAHRLRQILGPEDDVVLADARLGNLR